MPARERGETLGSCPSAETAGTSLPGTSREASVAREEESGWPPDLTAPAPLSYRGGYDGGGSARQQQTSGTHSPTRSFTLVGHSLLPGALDRYGP
jgi:hypothetical protein